MPRWLILAAAVTAGGIVLFLASPAVASTRTGGGAEPPPSPWETARSIFGNLWTTATGSKESADQLLESEKQLSDWASSRYNELRTGAAESVADQTSGLVDEITSWTPGKYAGALAAKFGL